MTRQELPPWVPDETTRKRKPRTPKPKEKKAGTLTKVHVKVNLSGSVEFDLEGPNAVELKQLLRGMKLDEVLEFVDPWASGAELRYDVEVTDLVDSSQWEANETTGTIESREPYFRPYWEFR